MLKESLTPEGKKMAINKQYLAGFFDAVGKIECLPEVVVRLSSSHHLVLAWLQSSLGIGQVRSELEVHHWEIKNKEKVAEFLEGILPHLTAKYDVSRALLRALRGEVDLLQVHTMIQLLERGAAEPLVGPTAALSLPTKADLETEESPPAKKNNVLQMQKRLKYIRERLEDSEEQYYRELKKIGYKGKVLPHFRCIPLKDAWEIYALLKEGFRPAEIAREFNYHYQLVRNIQAGRSWAELRDCWPHISQKLKAV
jgi:hypothetical protein